tara:strand:- start:574 stop:777 length:204 start_codon:yes stop_codon:yes gene_type:complete
MKNDDGVKDEGLSRVRLSVSLPRHLHDELERTAHENDTSIAWVVRKAVASYFEDRHDKQGYDGQRVQ